MGATASESRMFFALTTYFIVLTFILGFSPYSNGANFVIATDDVLTSNNAASNGFSPATKITTGIICAGTIGVAAILGFFTGGIGFIGVGALAVNCGVFGITLLAPSNVADSINVLAHNVFIFLTVFFELLTFQLAIPILMNILLVVPAAGTMMYLGVRVLRGGG